MDATSAETARRPALDVNGCGFTTRWRDGGLASTGGAAVEHAGLGLLERSDEGTGGSGRSGEAIFDERCGEEDCCGNVCTGSWSGVPGMLSLSASSLSYILVSSGVALHSALSAEVVS